MTHPRQTTTPGPWRQGVTRGQLDSGIPLRCICADAAPNHIVAWYSPVLTASEANAHLIAAAPDLYEALAEAANAIESLYQHGREGSVRTGEFVNAVVAKCRSALSRADGGE